MKVGIIDADLIGRKKHRFPNLVCMKLSAYYKTMGAEVSLIIDYKDVQNFDKLFLSKVFTDTEVPQNILGLSNIEYGGTGFFYDQAPSLPSHIEHIMPDYHLYDEWVDMKMRNGGKRKDFEYYLDYSIGFLTRGCFRKCQFCVNKSYSQCLNHSPINEFYDANRPKLCFLDDNFFACCEWKEIINTVKAIGKPFQFKQGLDERLLNDEKIHEIHSWNYEGDLIFAFDNIDDKAIIERNLVRIYELYPEWKQRLKFYVFCGYDRNDRWDNTFYINDIKDTFERIKVLAKYSAVPYIMRYEKCYKSWYHGIYSTLAGWCNQPNIFKKFSYELFCKCRGMGRHYSKYKRNTDQYIKDGNKKGAAWRYMESFSEISPQIAQSYFSFVPCEIAEYGPDAGKRHLKSA